MVVLLLNLGAWAEPEHRFGPQGRRMRTPSGEAPRAPRAFGCRSAIEYFAASSPGSHRAPEDRPRLGSVGLSSLRQHLPIYRHAATTNVIAPSWATEPPPPIVLPTCAVAAWRSLLSGPHHFARSFARARARFTFSLSDHVADPRDDDCGLVRASDRGLAQSTRS